MIKILKFPYDGTYVEGEQAVSQIIKMLIETPIGDIFYNRSRGSQIESLLFEQNDNILDTLANQTIRETLSVIKYIDLIDVVTSRDVEKMSIKIIWSFNDLIPKTTELEIPTI
ncbi:MAG: hypothetical protein MUC49_15505 [Raineya sp.]|jgi:hypothetical protein|nr:hypothetical protein [Raineya sp.]